MQIIEATDAGVRAVELRLRRPGSPLQFLLYPMIHVGSPQFYQEVARRLGEVDLIVAEGVGHSPTSERLTSAYRNAVNEGQLGLVVQDIDYEALGVPVLNPDFSGSQVDERWATIPGWQRGILRAGFGSMAAAQRLIGPRLLEFQLRHSPMDDLPNLEEIFSPALMDNFDRVILHERDDLLLAALTQVHEQRSSEAITVAVVYGAAHMRSVVTRLRPLGYRVVGGDWLTIVEF